MNLDLFNASIKTALRNAGYETPIQCPSVSQELVQDLRCVFGIDPFEEMVNLIRAEINMMIIQAKHPDYYKANWLKTIEKLHGWNYATKMLERIEKETQPILNAITDEIDWGSLSPISETYYKTLRNQGHG